MQYGGKFQDNKLNCKGQKCMQYYVSIQNRTIQGGSMHVYC